MFATAGAFLALVMFATMLVKERAKTRELREKESYIHAKERALKELEIKLRGEEVRIESRQHAVNEREKTLRANEFKLWVRSSMFLLYPLVQAIYSFNNSGTVPIEIIIGLAVSIFIFIIGGYFTAKLFGAGATTPPVVT